MRSTSDKTTRLHQTTVALGVAGAVGSFLGGFAGLGMGLHPAFVLAMLSGGVGGTVLLWVIRRNRDAGGLEMNAAGKEAPPLAMADEASASLARREAALHELEQEFQLFYTYSPDVFSRLSLDGRWLSMSPGIERATGLPPSHFIGKHMDDVGMPEDLVAKWHSAVEALKQTGREQSVTWEFPSPDGVRHYEARAAPVWGRDGEMTSYIVVTRDITERVRAEADQAHWRNVLGLALEAAHAGAWEFDVKTQTSTWSEELCRLLGLPDADRAADYHRWLSMVHPDDRERMETNIMQALSSGADRVDDEYRMILPDGRERHFYDVGRVIRDAEGNPERVVGFQIDVTERKEAEVELRRSRDTIRMALEVAQAGAWEWNLETGETSWSDELYRILGYEKGSVTPGYEAWRRTVYPDDLEKVEQILHRALETPGETYRAEYRLVRPTGEVRWTFDTGQILRNDEGKPVRMVGFQHDVTERVQGAMALRDEVEFRKSIIERATEGICVCVPIEEEPGIRFTVWNPRMESITGYTLEEINRLGWYQTVYPDPDTAARAARRMEEMRDGRDLEAEEWEITRKNGDKRVVLISTKIVQSQSREAAVLAIMHDVTEERRAARALVESEERYRNIVETCLEGIWTIDADGVTDFVNPQMAAMLGYTVEEMLGRHLFDFMDDEARREAEKNLRRRQEGVSEEHDFRLRHKSGRDVWTRMATTAFKGTEGEYAGALAIVTDITRLREAETEAERTRALLRAAFEASPAGIVVARAPDGEAIMANSAALTIAGETEEPSDATDLGSVLRKWQFLRPDGEEYQEDRVPLARAIVHGETSKDVELLIRDHAGGLHWVLANAAPVLDGEGRIEAAVMVFVDISARIAADQEIRKLNTDLERRVRERTAELDAANKELEGFSYSVSHDLRAPLRGIDGWSLALIEDCGDELSDTAREYLERIRSESQRMGMLIDDLLRLARVSRGRFTVEPIDISALARRVANRIDEHDAFDRPVTWTIQPGLMAQGDERLVEVALENLFANARKFTGLVDAPRVEFGARETDRGQEFFVRDNGAGFDMEFADKLFRPFQRLHSQAEFAGTGIGLATVQRVVRRHGGTVRAEGEVGRGATFYFTLS